MNSSLELCRGYISSRTFSGNWVPQHIQNTIIRNYCNINNLHYLLSSAEYSIENSYIENIDLLNFRKITFYGSGKWKNRFQKYNLIY